MNENFRIEDAKPDDVIASRMIARDAWLELYPNAEYGITREDIATIDWTNPVELEKRRKEIEKGGDLVHVWVIKNSKDEVVGFCKARRYPDSHGEIRGMYVIKELQGQGLGKLLMQKAFDWLGNVEIKLKVVKYNTNAIEFYKKMGFKEIGKLAAYDGTLLPSGKDIPRIEMVRSKSVL